MLSRVLMKMALRRTVSVSDSGDTELMRRAAENCNTELTVSDVLTYFR